MSVRRLAIVPARGGSKRIPDKNIREFCGRPMIAHILDAARRAGLFDVIHVSTESPRIAATATALGFPPEFGRPAELADDHTPIMPVLKFVASTFLDKGRQFDEIWSLTPCAALIEPHDLRGAAERFAAMKPARPLLAVASYPAPIEWAFDIGPGGALVPVQPDMFAVRSQDLTPKYYDTGSFAVFPANHVLTSQGAGDAHSFVGYPLPRHKAVDIDNEDDWRMAEMLFKIRCQRVGQ